MSEINSYLLNEETRRKINHSHFELGEGKVRELHNRHKERLKRVEELAKELGVEYNPVLESAEEIIKQKELIQKYYEDKEKYDSVLNPLLEILDPEIVLKFIEKQLNKS